MLMGLDIEWGLGLMLNRGIVGSAGLGGTRFFGHFGMGGSVGWADPDLGLGMGYVMNQMEIGTTGDKRSYRLMNEAVDAARRAPEPRARLPEHGEAALAASRSSTVCIVEVNS